MLAGQPEQSSYRLRPLAQFGHLQQRVDYTPISIAQHNINQISLHHLGLKSIPLFRTSIVSSHRIYPKL